MGIDLKPYFDGANIAGDEVQKILNEMNIAFTDGTEEGKAKAIELRPSLDTAQAKAKEANELYISMRNASAMEGSAAQNFVPVPQPNNVTSQESNAKEMTREAFDALDSAARMKFIKGGGKVTKSAE